MIKVKARGGESIQQFFPFHRLLFKAEFFDHRERIGGVGQPDKYRGVLGIFHPTLGDVFARFQRSFGQGGKQRLRVDFKLIVSVLELPDEIGDARYITLYISVEYLPEGRHHLIE